jgi:hypothetical protein
MNGNSTCPLCKCTLISGPSVDKHHLIPKSRGGETTEPVHVVCHRKIHSTFSEADLSQYYYTWSRLREHSEIKKFVKWVKKQFNRDPEYIDVHRDTKERKRKR